MNPRNLPCNVNLAGAIHLVKTVNVPGGWTLKCCELVSRSSPVDLHALKVKSLRRALWVP